MSSASLPSPSSLLPVQQSRDLVTASVLLHDLQLHQPVSPPDGPATDAAAAVSAQEPVVLDSALYTKTGRLRKSRKKAGDSAGAATKPPPKPPSHKKPSDSGATATISKDEPSVAPKRSRKAKVGTEDAAKPAPKRGRKKAAETDPSAEPGKKQRAPPKPRKIKAATAKTTNVDDLILPDGVSDEAPDKALARRVTALEADLTKDSHLEPAPTRRCDWTPPPFQHSIDTSPVNQLSVHMADNESVSPVYDASGDHDESVDALPTAVNFTSLMGDFGYQENSAAPSVPKLSRTPSDQPTTKRKRLDPVEVTATAKAPAKRKKDTEPKAKPRRKDSEPKPKPPKKPRAPKKKPVTITALATAAYRPQAPEASTEQSKTISEFFTHPDQAVNVSDKQDATKSTSKSTKRRNTDDKPAPTRKRTKKVQITVPEIPIKLDSPEAARENMKHQQWLFGSSSQLAGAESPTELRDLQRALKESEEMVCSQHVEPIRATSYARVPSAPHGTSLSIAQANKVLWMSAARDFEDSTFASDEAPDVHVEETAVDSFQLIDNAPPVAKSTLKEQTEPEAALPPEFVEISSSDRPANETISLNLGYIDIDEIVPETEANRVDERPLSNDNGVLAATPPSEGIHEVVVLDPSPETSEVSRSALGSLDPNTSLSKPMFGTCNKPITSNASRPFSTKGGKVQDLQPGPSPGRNPPKPTSSSPLKIGRLRKIGPSPEPTSRGRGRPRIFGPSPEPTPRGRGRPRIFGPSPEPTSRGRGRPRIFGPSPEPKEIPQGSGRTTPSRGRGRPRKIQSPSRRDVSSGYLDIDDIDDPENILITSPPRLPPGSPIQPLELDGPAPAAPRTAKQIQAEWDTISITLFPHISAIINAAPPSTNHKTPSWNEKMLLYDPIVLEDLTAWLNAQGIRLEIERPKVVKGKKGKAKVGAEEDKETDMETLREALQPWMVQKWCEDQSVCCLWKEGLRGGVRQKY